MKILRIALFMTFLLLPALTGAAELKQLSAAARITAVTIYADRAQTTRNAVFNLKPGSYLIIFENLPVLMQDDSVRVDGNGTAGATIAALEIKRVFLPQTGEKRQLELQAEILALEKLSATLDAKKSGLTAQKAFYESIRVAWGDRISKELAIGRPTVTELQDASVFIASGISKATEQGQEIEFEQKTVRDKIDALRRQLYEATGSERRESKTVEVAIEISREGTLTLELVSMIGRAGWEPVYDVRLASDARSATLTFQATVRQQTGEDWRNIDLTLSTARPAIGGAPPELHPWKISLHRPQPVTSDIAFNAATAPYPTSKQARKADRALMMKNPLLENDADEGVPVAFAAAQLRDEQSSVSFHVPRRLDIPADGASHATVIATEQLPVSIEYQSVPKLSPAAYLKSGITNHAPYPLLPGKVNTFLGNRYTGSSALKKVASGESFELFFGTDDQLMVKREELKQHKGAGLFGNNRVSYRYRMELDNFHKEPLTLTVRDQLPFAADEEIKVSLEEPSIKPEEITASGIITWKALLQPGEKKVLTFGILVEYPKERELIGL